MNRGDDFIGVTITRDDIGWFGDDTAAKFRALVKKTSYDFEAVAKVNAPVDTGALRASITTEFENDGMTGVISVGVEYGVYQEYGTDRCPPHPFMRPAMDAVEHQFMEALGRIIRGETGGGGHE